MTAIKKKSDDKNHASLTDDKEKLNFSKHKKKSTNPNFHLKKTVEIAGFKLVEKINNLLTTTNRLKISKFRETKTFERKVKNAVIMREDKRTPHSSNMFN